MYQNAPSKIQRKNSIAVINTHPFLFPSHAAQAHSADVKGTIRGKVHKLCVLQASLPPLASSLTVCDQH